LIKLDFLSNRAASGQQAERTACEYLLGQGLKLVEKNYRCRRGEIDLIMQHGDTLVFVEVRYRKNHDFGGASASVTPKKQKKIHTTALHYMQHLNPNTNARFDVIAITGSGKQQQFEWIQNAF
jgi:putative endonuclease